LGIPPTDPPEMLHFGSQPVGARLPDILTVEQTAILQFKIETGQAVRCEPSLRLEA
jgi:hypothetical protein